MRMVATSPGSAALFARQPGQRRVCACARSVFETDSTRVSSCVERRQKLAYRLLPSARLVAPRHVGNLHMFDQLAVALERFERVTAHHADVVLVQLESHAG